MVKIETVEVTSVSGVAVSMVAFQAVDPGSIPGRRTLLFVSILKKYIEEKFSLPLPGTLFYVIINFCLI